MKILQLLLTVLVGGLMMIGVAEMPNWGDPDSPANSHVSPHYIEKAYDETAVPNLVTAVLADYRSYDTFGETTVVFTAGICCLLLLRRFGREEDEQ